MPKPKMYFDEYGVPYVRRRGPVFDTTGAVRIPDYTPTYTFDQNQDMHEHQMEMDSGMGHMLGKHISHHTQQNLAWLQHAKQEMEFNDLVVCTVHYSNGDAEFYLRNNDDWMEFPV